MRPYLLGGTYISLGASTITKLSAGQFLGGFILTKITSGAPLYIVPGPSASVVGWPVPDGRDLNVGGPAQFFLATQATACDIAILHSFTEGATGLPTLRPGGLL